MATATTTKTPAAKKIATKKTAKPAAPAATSTAIAAPPSTEVETAIKLLKMPVVVGLQAGRPYYATMVPYKMLATMFPQIANLKTQELPIEERYQRDLDPGRGKSIARYVRNRMKDGQNYVLGAVSVSVQSDACGLEEKPHGMGLLTYSAQAIFRSRDGQHRIRGLILATEKDPTIGDETIAVTLYHFRTIEEEQQAFSDQNRLVRPAPKSLTMAFNWDDPDVIQTRELLDNVTRLKSMIDYDRAKCKKTSALVFSFQEIHRAMQIMSHGMTEKPEGFIGFATEFWSIVVDHVYAKMLPGAYHHAQSAREVLISPTMLALEAIALEGAQLRDKPLDVLPQSLERLKLFNWDKTNPEMLAVCAPGGKIVKNATTVQSLHGLIFEQGEF